MAAKPKPLGEFTRFMREHEEALEPRTSKFVLWGSGHGQGIFSCFLLKRLVT